MDTDEKFLTTREVAKIMRYEVRTIQRWCNEGKKFPSAFKDGREWRIPEKEVLRQKSGGNIVQLKSQDAQLKGNRLPHISAPLISEIKELAKKIKQLTNIPKSSVSFLPDNMKDENKIVDKYIEGDSHPTLLALLAASTPWWTPTGSVQIRRHLNLEQEALLEYLLGLPQSQTLMELIVEWEDNANYYVNLKRSHSNPHEIEVAYYIAVDTTQRLNLELRKLIITLSTNIA